MTITVEKLSLLGSLAPLRHKLDPDTAFQNSGFADRLDQAIGIEGSSVSSAGSNARELAQSLTLQMLQSTLSLAGDSSTESPSAVRSSPFSSTNSLLQAYRANLAAGEGGASPAVSVPSQALAVDVPESSPPSQTLKKYTDVAWLDPIIAKASRKYGVDVSLIKAVIKAESNFNPQAVSNAGARGLMQLMPATARSLGVTDSHDPEQNVMGGTRFLKDMLQRYNGNVDSALAAYNWGPGNVDKRPDHLPRETRNYLMRVKELYNSYNG